MARRAARRAAETPEWLRDTPEEAAARRLAILRRHQLQLGRCFHKPPEKRKRTRPSDGQESGAPFDYEEYLTRLEDKKAADPEFMARVKAFQERRRARLDSYKERQELERANAEVAEDLREWAEHGWSRLENIWTCVINAENEERWRKSPTLSQAQRIAATPRIRGCGAAAKRAGFAG